MVGTQTYAESTVVPDFEGFVDLVRASNIGNGNVVLPQMITTPIHPSSAFIPTQLKGGRRT